MAGSRRRAAGCWRRWRRVEPALGGLSWLAHADPQRAVPAVPRGCRRNRGQSRSRSRTAGGRGGRDRIFSGPSRAVRDRLRQPLDRRHRQCHAWARGPGLFPSRLRRARAAPFASARMSMPSTCAGIEARRRLDERALVAARRRSLTHARMDGERRGSFLDGLRPAQTPEFAGNVRAGWERDGKERARSCCAVSARNMRTTSTRAAQSRDHARRFGLMAARPAACRSSRAAKI